MKKIVFFKDYLVSNYGKALYRVPVDLALSCPHRDKRNGRGGCHFCPENGARAIHLQQQLNLEEQVAKGVRYVRSRYGNDCGLIAYFQAFTSTHGEPAELKALYDKVLEQAAFDMVIISTRPDCLSGAVLQLLDDLNKRFDLWIELGVQTANDTTLKAINRGHDFQAVKDAVIKLKRLNIKTAAHVILGLPGETFDDYLYTARQLAALPFSGIKVHNLLVLKNTVMAKMYHKKEFECLNEYEYADALVAFLRELPEDWPVMRINADADKQHIIAPKWWMKKGQFIDYVISRMEEIEEGTPSIPKVKTEDGSYTFYHPEFKQHFHTLAGARSEAEEKFLIPCGLREKLQNDAQLNILDVGFGLGYNALSAAKLAEDIQQGHIAITTLEYDKKTLDIARGIYNDDSVDSEIINLLHETSEWCGEYAAINLQYGDARQLVCNMQDKGCKSFDIVFLDAFSPDANPELWTFDFLQMIKSIMSPNGLLVTYSSAYPVRGALVRNGFYVGETDPFGRRRGGTIASLCETLIDKPLSEKDMGVVLHSTSGVPYRDCSLNWSRKKIADYRRRLVTRLRKCGIPKWYNPKGE